MKSIKVLGIGPGHPDYLLPITKRIIRECEVLVGGDRQIMVRDEMDDQEVIPFSLPLENIMEKIRAAAQTRQVGVLVSGDAGYYSLLAALRRFFSPDELDVYPGISSMQYMFARLGLPWCEAELGSLHGRSWNWMEIVRERKLVGMLTDKKQSPTWIAKRLMEEGIQDCWMAVGENLSYVDEKIEKFRPEEARRREFETLSVVVIGYE